MKKLAIVLLFILPVCVMSQPEGSSEKPKTIPEIIKNYEQMEDCNTLIVEETMFELFDELGDEVEPEALALMKKLKLVCMLECNMCNNVEDAEDVEDVENYNYFYEEMIRQVDTKAYKVLLRSKEDGRKMIFFEKKHKEGDREFLVISDEILVNIRGDIKLKTIYEIEEILAFVGEILPH